MESWDLPQLETSLAEAFSAEEKNDATICGVALGTTLFRLLTRSVNFNVKKKSFWGATVTRDAKLKDDQIVLRYRRAKSGIVQPMPPPENRAKRYRRKVHLKKPTPPSAKNLKKDEPVWYYPYLGGPRFAAVVDSEPWVLGGHTEVVRLRELGRDYVEATGRDASTVPSAATTNIERRHVFT